MLLELKKCWGQCRCYSSCPNSHPYRDEVFQGLGRLHLASLEVSSLGLEIMIDWPCSALTIRVLSFWIIVETGHQGTQTA